MKTLLLLGALGLSFQSSAALQCPEGSSLTYSCSSTPLGADSLVASDLLDHVLVCRSGEKSILVLEKNGEASVQVATVDQRVGGASFSVTEATTSVELSLPQGLSPSVTVILAKLKVVITGTFTGEPIEASSTYSCTQK
mgnify:CR=1 FL=1